jgi:hypothetical protein
MRASVELPVKRAMRGALSKAGEEMDLDRVPSAWRLLVPADDDGGGDL